MSTIKTISFIEGGIKYRTSLEEQGKLLISDPEKRNPSIGTVRIIDGRMFYLKRIECLAYGSDYLVWNIVTKEMVPT